MDAHKTDTQQKTPLGRAIAATGSMSNLARRLGVTKGAVFQWSMPGRRVPAEHCPCIEMLTNGAVMCEELRPDMEWGVLRSKAQPQQPEASTKVAAS